MGVSGIKTFTYLIYFNCSDLFDITVFKIKFDQGVYEQEVARADKIMESDVLDLPKEGQFVDGCKYCGWKEECKSNSRLEGKTERTKYIKTTPPTNKAITKKYIELEKLEADKAAIIKEIGALQAELVNMLQRSNHEFVAVGNGKQIGLKQGNPRRTLDKKALNDYLASVGDTELDEFYRDGKIPDKKLDVRLIK
jgi:hypothetical protein